MMTDNGELHTKEMTDKGGHTIGNYRQWEMRDNG